MKKSITSINPKVKQQNKKQKNKQNILIAIQFILTIAVIIIGIISLINKSLIPIFQLTCGLTIIDMGINNKLIYKRPYLTGIYIAIGIFFIILSILKGFGL